MMSLFQTQIAAAAGVQTEGILVTKEDMDSAMADLKKEHDEVLRDHESSLQEQRESLSGLEKALMNVDNLGERVGDTESEVLALSQSIEAVEVCSMISRLCHQITIGYCYGAIDGNHVVVCWFITDCYVYSS